MEKYKIIVNKPTVPVGSADMVTAIIRVELNVLGKEVSFDVVSNSEFLREGAAVSDCMEPERIIIGTRSNRAAERMRELYSPFLGGKTQFIGMDARSAELTKYAANSMLAAKISFINEIADMAEILGADIEMVRQGLGSDSRIGPRFINPGCGYGGSCFPKDIKALIRTAEEKGYNPQMLYAVELVNNRQKEKLFSMISEHYYGKLRGLTFTLWGLAFKPGTDDMRKAPSRALMEVLWDCGAKVKAYDPKAAKEARRIYGDNPLLTLSAAKEEALCGADALIVCTEWQEFREVPLEAIKEKLKFPVIFDGRNIFNIKEARELEFVYYGIGCGLLLRTSERPRGYESGEATQAS